MFRPRAVVKPKKAAAAPVATPAPLATSAPDAPASTSTTPSTSAPLIPRALAKRSKPTPTASTSKASEDERIASTSRALAAVKLNHQEEQRLETILLAIESSFCDWGLSVHPESGLLQRIKTSKDGYVHLQHVLNLQPVRALTDIQADVQKALKLRPSPSLTVHESGFQIRRTTTPDYERLEQLHPADWDDMALYLENVPTLPTSPEAPTSLSVFLSTLLGSQLQRLILPPLYDPSNPPTETYTPTFSANDQSEVFARSQAAASGKEVRRKGKVLPTGGGPFRGYAFVVVASKEDAERILKEWVWERNEEAVEEDVKMEEDGAEEAKPASQEPAALARRSGFRALSYSRWLDLKIEYLAYQHHLTNLRDSHDRERKSHAYKERARRSPSPPRPSRADARAREVDPPSSSSAKKGKRPSGERDQQGERDRPLKKVKRASDAGPWETRGPLDGREEDVGLEDVAPDSEEALQKKGAFPQGCILWVRNVHEKSSKTSLRTVFSGLLEELEEGSGRGVEFADYEKGLDVCHLRFSSSHLASLMHAHLTNSTCTHLAPLYISSPQSTATPPEDVEFDPTRRPLASQLLQGERERIYWQGLPESTRRGARKSAGGPVALVKTLHGKGKKVVVEDAVENRVVETGGEGDEEERRRAKEEEEAEKRREREKAEEEEKRPRKKPTKF